MSAREALLVGTQGGAKNLGRDDVGRIAPGMAADFVAWRTDGVSFAGAQHDLVAALLFCTPGLAPVDLSVINGEVIVKDGQLTTCNLQVSTIFKKTTSELLFGRRRVILRMVVQPHLIMGGGGWGAWLGLRAKVHAYLLHLLHHNALLLLLHDLLGNTMQRFCFACVPMCRQSWRKCVLLVCSQQSGELCSLVISHYQNTFMYQQDI